VPGRAPAAPYFLLLRQKKVCKEKASRRTGRFAVPCAARIWRGRAELGYRLKQRPPFSARRCAAQPVHTAGSEYPRHRPVEPSLRHAGGNPLPLPAVMRWREAQGRADQGWRCLSRRRVQPDPARTEQRSVPAATLRDSASGSPFLWALSFGEAKESASAAGPRPGTPQKRTHRTKVISVQDRPQSPAHPPAPHPASPPPAQTHHTTPSPSPKSCG
jgi:hypothetical protein